MLLATAAMIANTPKILFAFDIDYIFLLDQTPCCNCIGLLLGATRSTLGLRVFSFLFGTSGFLLCSKCRNLLLTFGLYLGQLCGECNDLIFLADLTFPSAVPKNVVVCLNCQEESQGTQKGSSGF